MLLLQNAHALQTLRQWACASRRRRGAKRHRGAQARRHAPHKHRHSAVRSYNARLHPSELTNKNAHHYCPTICAIRNNKLLNHKRIGMPRPGSAKKKPPPLPAPPLCKVGSRMSWQKRRALQQNSGLRRRHQNNIALGVGGGFRVGAFFSLAQEGAQSAL